MHAEEAVPELVAGRELVLHEGVDPGGGVLLVTVTVGLVVHDLAGTDPLPVVNLPEDDTTVPGTAEAVAVGSAAQLGVGQIAGGDYGLAELRMQGEGTPDEV